MSGMNERREINEVRAFLMQAANRLLSLETTSAPGKSFIESVRSSCIIHHLYTMNYQVVYILNFS